MSPNRLFFQPPKPCQAIGTGIGTLMPTMPTWMRRLNSRATLPSRVKQRHAVAEFVALIRSTASLKSGTRTQPSTGPKISSL
jgi:hypothetical protein